MNRLGDRVTRVDRRKGWVLCGEGETAGLDVPVELDRKEIPAADERRVFGWPRLNYGE